VSSDWERLDSDARCLRRKRNDCEEAAPPATMATDKLKDNVESFVPSRFVQIGAIINVVSQLKHHNRY
jgi:hypothetical protein